MKIPSRVTQQWLEEAFAPVAEYLERRRPDDAALILEQLMFTDNEEGVYLYTNRLSRSHIAFDGQGELLYCQEEALQYRYSWSPGFEEEVCAAAEEQDVHENVEGWLESSVAARFRQTYGEDVKRFLQMLWGPLTDYRFDDLTADRSARSLSPASSFYLYSNRAPNPLAFEFLPAEPDDPGKRQEREKRRELLSLGGWTVITLNREALEHHLPLLRERLRFERRRRR
ncbi:hypothetical protein [Cohnella fermenti]|uniref:Uncharacterized protein n=1 Tax=Cohnella fermenti TaxID=2565925 RepID=A0A4S4CB06_9BACL|nr:hypothetical protein [Cohnella fermenti]THF84658.1 hypothetical protein E6C55_01400 [Cohnella fermenti]